MGIGICITDSLCHLPETKHCNSTVAQYKEILKNSKTTRTYCVAHGAVLNVMWQPGQEGNLEEN